MNFSLTQIADNADMLVATSKGPAVLRVERLSEHPEATPVPYCAGCRKTFETTEAMNSAHLGAGGNDRGHGPHTWGWLDDDRHLLLTDG
jgi:hypothetical protein